MSHKERCNAKYDDHWKPVTESASPEEAAMIEETNPEFILTTIGDIASSKGMTQLAKDAENTRYIDI